MINNCGHYLFSGPTGVGKSSVIEQLHRKLNCRVYSDPYVGNPFISGAYLKNDKCFQSQLFFFKEFLKIHKDIKNNSSHSIVLQERSIFESIHIFCSNLLLEGNFNMDEYNVLKELLEEVSPYISFPNIIFYFTAPTQVIRERIAQRGRVFEANIDFSFIERQLYLYDKWLDSLNKFSNTEIIHISTEGESAFEIGELLYDRYFSNQL